MRELPPGHTSSSPPSTTTPRPLFLHPQSSSPPLLPNATLSPSFCFKRLWEFVDSLVFHLQVEACLLSHSQKTSPQGTQRVDRVFRTLRILCHLCTVSRASDQWLTPSTDFLSMIHSAPGTRREDQRYLIKMLNRVI